MLCCCIDDRSTVAHIKPPNKEGPLSPTRLKTTCLSLALLLGCLTTPAHAAPDQTEAGAEPDPAQLSVRHNQLALHQGVALATLGAMATTATLGFLRSNANLGAEWREVHLLAAGLTSGLYLTTGALALSAPPPLIPPEPGQLDSVSLHRGLAWLHAATMASTVGLGAATVFGADTQKFHGLAGWTTLGLMAASAGVIAF